jgi:hypothetical protein
MGSRLSNQLRKRADPAQSGAEPRVMVFVHEDETFEECAFSFDAFLRGTYAARTDQAGLERQGV